MGNVLCFVETAGDKVRGASLPAITFGREAARQHGGELTLLICGASAARAAEEARRFGARVLLAEAPGLEPYAAEVIAPVVERAARAAGATLVCAGATSTGKDLLPRVAALLDAGMASDVTALLGPRTFRRPMAAGNALARVEVTTPIVVASVRTTEFPPAAPADAPGALERLEPGPIDARGATVVGMSTTQSARPDLTEARVVVSGGRGMREGANFQLLEQLADLLGGAMGASRAACDAGMVPNDLQVGQTGKVVAPELYIAVAISGAIQHLAGMKGSRVIVAINKDADAPIFQVADYGLVATWEKAVPELLEELRRLKAAQA